MEKERTHQKFNSSCSLIIDHFSLRDHRKKLKCRRIVLWLNSQTPNAVFEDTKRISGISYLQNFCLSLVCFCAKSNHLQERASYGYVLPKTAVLGRISFWTEFSVTRQVKRKKCPNLEKCPTAKKGFNCFLYKQKYFRVS